MKYILTFICVIVCFSCAIKPNNHLLTGDLTFKSVSLTSFYGITEDKYQKLLIEIDTVLANPEKYKSSIKLYKYVASLEKHKILRAPQIFMYAAKDSIINVYLSEKAYKKVKHFNYRDLQKEQKKVVLQLHIIQKEKYIFYAEDILSVTKVDGKSKINGRVMTFMNR